MVFVASRTQPLTYFCPKVSYNPKNLIRRDKYSGVNAAVTFDIRDDVAEAIGIYSRRVAEVFARKPAASNRYRLCHAYQTLTKYRTSPMKQSKRYLKLVIRQVNNSIGKTKSHPKKGG